MAVLTNVDLQSELEAVNAVLRAVGEDPISDVDNDSHAWKDHAVNILRDSMREVGTLGWSFNTDLQFRIAKNDPADTFTVPSRAGGDPGDLLAFKCSERVDQIGGRYAKQDDGTYASTPAELDIAVRGTTFWSRLENTDEFGDSDERPQIFIDAVWSLSWSETPQAFRHYVTVKAARKFAEEVLGSRDRGRFKEKDEVIAWNTLVREHSRDEDAPPTIFDNMITSLDRGYRTTNWIR